MIRILPDIIRSAASDTLILLLLYSLAHPKNKMTVFICYVIFIITDCILESGSYLNGSYSSVVLINLFFGIPSMFIAKVLFRESFFQWCFNVLTAANIFIMTVFISYHLSDLFPYPLYANTVIRTVILGGLAILFYKKLRKLYSAVLKRWYIYVLPALGIFMCFAYLFIFCGDIETVLVEKAVLLSLISITAVFVYVMIFWSFQSVSDEYNTREMAARVKMDQELLQSELMAYDTFVNAAKQSRHDIRHHDAVIMEYLDSGNIQGAVDYINSHDEMIRNMALHEFCKNKTANAVFRIYERKTATENIEFSVTADIDEDIRISPPELCVMLSNILENALHACETCKSEKCHITMRAAAEDGRLLIELKNSVSGEVEFENGIPVSGNTHGGNGIPSVMAAVEKYGGMTDFSVQDGEFITRISILL